MLLAIAGMGAFLLAGSVCLGRQGRGVVWSGWVGCWCLEMKLGMKMDWRGVEGRVMLCADCLGLSLLTALHLFYKGGTAVQC